jgi:hypothetical protein
MFEFTWAIGIIVLGLVIFFFATRQRRLKGAERQMSDQAARRNWGKEEIH